MSIKILAAFQEDLNSNYSILSFELNTVARRLLIYLAKSIFAFIRPRTSIFFFKVNECKVTFMSRTMLTNQNEEFLAGK